MSLEQQIPSHFPNIMLPASCYGLLSHRSVSQLEVGYRLAVFVLVHVNSLSWLLLRCLHLSCYLTAGEGFGVCLASCHALQQLPLPLTFVAVKLSRDSKRAECGH
jgi:hypothetical protein